TSQKLLQTNNVRLVRGAPFRYIIIDCFWIRFAGALEGSYVIANDSYTTSSNLSRFSRRKLQVISNDFVTYQSEPTKS
ncbi:MAG TPA: hypothetical protein PKE52_09255, partial [Bacteroidales bacterium]|nr:hypothetical protein [Bacteroidales bacterium]